MSYPSDNYEYSKYYDGKVYLGKEDFNLTEFNRNQGYHGKNITHPDIKFYTYFSLKEYFIIFWGLYVLQIIIIFIVKRLMSTCFKELNFLDKIIHSFENVHFPFSVHDWDSDGGNCEEHKRRMISNQKEVFVIIIINLIFNWMLLFPLIILCKVLFIC